MNRSDPVLFRFAADLREVIATRDVPRLDEYLSGRHLPAFGDDLTPADVIRRAIEPDPGVTTELAEMLSYVLRAEWHRLGEAENLDARSRFILRNIYSLAADLPTHPELHRALRSYPGAMVMDKDASELMALRVTALVYQQVDNSLESDWFEWLTSKNNEFLITGWRGLLWVPPAGPSADVIDLDRLEKGLQVLQDTVKDRHDGPDLLRYALDILCETYPRSSRFWESSFAPRLGSWPEGLQEEILRRWPALRRAADLARRTRLAAG